MSEDSRTLWVGNLDDKVTEDLLYELFLQAGPLDRLVFPTEGEGENKKHRGHAYIVFKHSESVQYASQVMDGSSLFNHVLKMNARSLPITYKKSAPHKDRSHGGNNSRFDNSRFDNSSLRTGFNKSNTWHGHNNEFMPKGRGGGGGYRNRGGNYNNSSTMGNMGYNNYNNQGSGGAWMGNQGGNAGMNQMGYNNQTSDNSGNVDDKRARILQQQNITLDAHRQIQQGNMMNMPNMYNMQQQQAQWMGGGSGVFPNQAAGNWNMQGSGDPSQYHHHGYTDQQFQGNWYQGQ